MSIRLIAKFWYRPEWEAPAPDIRELKGFDIASWPDADLVRSLIDLFFQLCNPFLPLLHQPTFERDFAAELYKTNWSFTKVCLALFAYAARFSNDPRVLIDESKRDCMASGKGEGSPDVPIRYSAGWKYIQLITQEPWDWNRPVRDPSESMRHSA